MTNIAHTKNATPSVEMIKRGLIVGLPIIIGYFPIAITYGVLAKQAGLTLLELTLMSVMVYAGASQFMAVNMFAVGAGASEIVIATFVLNFRHFIMSLSFMNSFREVGINYKLPVGLGLTDETFAVTTLHKEDNKNGPLFYLTIILTAYLSWVAGSFIGGLLGEVIPEQLSQSMGIALYAMFIGLLVPSIKKEMRIGFIAIIAMLINLICSQFLSSGWSIVMGTIFGGLSGVFLLKEDRET